MPSLLGAVHILRQPGEGGWVRQMLTKADEGGRGQKNFQQWEFRGSKILVSEKN